MRYQITLTLEVEAETTEDARDVVRQLVGHDMRRTHSAGEIMHADMWREKAYAGAERMH